MERFINIKTSKGVIMNSKNGLLKMMAAAVCAAGIFGSAVAQDENTISEEQENLAVETKDVSEENKAVRPKAEIVAELDAITTEMTSKDYVKRQKQLKSFVAKTQKIETILRAGSINSSAPAAFEIASLSVEMLRTTLDVTQQVPGLYKRTMGKPINGVAEENVEEKNLAPGTFLPLILKAIFVTAPDPIMAQVRANPRMTISLFAISLEDYDLTEEQFVSIVNTALTALNGGNVLKIKDEITRADPATKVQISSLLAFSTGTLAVTIPQLKLMTKAIRNLKEIKRAGI